MLERADLARLYERKGLLPEAERNASGYRLLTPDDLDVLHFIRQAKTLDLTLEEIKDVLDLQRCGEQPCELRRLRRSLLSARQDAGTARCEGQDAVVCRIIENAALAPAEPTRST